MKDKIKLVRDLAKNINEFDLDGIEYESEDFKVELIKEPKLKSSKSVVVPTNDVIVKNDSSNLNVAPEALKEDVVTEVVSGHEVKSPMVGTFYASPAPGEEVFVKEGDMVEKGQVLCIVEAMKLMNEVKSPVSGQIKKILVNDKDSIKKEDVLMIIN